MFCIIVGVEGIKMPEKDWHTYFLKMAELVASKSKDRSTKVGAVLVGPDNEIRSTGFNGFPRGIDDDVEDRHVRPSKYEWTEHAERNAILNAARCGIVTKGCTLYINFCPIPCTACARAVIQAGIVRVVGKRTKTFTGKGDHWSENLRIAEEMCREAGIELVWVGDE